MTDEQIIKALQCCKSFNDLRACYKCPALKNGDCSNGKVYISDFILDNALDLINRQKAEIERLRQKIKEIDEHFCEGEIGKGMAIVINLVKEITESPAKIEHNSLCETETYKTEERE